MKPEIKAMWVRALRGPESVFKQGYGRLWEEQTGRYCCLGVLCELHRIVTGEGRWEAGSYVTCDSSSPSFLTTEVKAWAGLVTANPWTSDESGRQLTLSGWNDGDIVSETKRDSKNFSEIADMIERSL